MIVQADLGHGSFAQSGRRATTTAPTQTLAQIAVAALVVPSLTMALYGFALYACQDGEWVRWGACWRTEREAWDIVFAFRMMWELSGDYTGFKVVRTIQLRWPTYSALGGACAPRPSPRLIRSRRRHRDRQTWGLATHHSRY